MARIRILEGVAGADFSWTPGDVVDLPAEEAAKWADGYRAEYVTPPAKAPEAGEEASGDVTPEVAEKAAVRSRGGGRSRRAETR